MIRHSLAAEYAVACWCANELRKDLASLTRARQGYPRHRVLVRLALSGLAEFTRWRIANWESHARTLARNLSTDDAEFRLSSSSHCRMTDNGCLRTSR